jgi:hypothetical protein
MAQVSIRREIRQPSFNVTGNSGGGVGIQLQQTANKFARPAAASRFAPPPPLSPLDEEVEGIEDALNEIANPGKVQEGSVASSYTDGEYDDEDDDEDYDDESEADPVFAPPVQEKPSPGFLTIEDEKADIMFRLELLRKQGLDGRRFSARDDIREMRAELTRIKTHLEMDRSLKFSRKALVGLTAALEFMNDKVDVLDLELDGWSEQMHQAVYNQKEYDGIFEELFFKYRGKMSTPPEIRLLMAVGGSALTFHITNSMMKKTKAVEQPAIDPATIQRLMAAGARPEQPPAGGGVPQPQRPEPTTAQRREMRPPGGGFGGFGGGDDMHPFGFAKPPVGLPVNLNDPVQSRNSDARRVSFTPPVDDDDESDRLSDVPSDLESVPSGMSSPDEQGPGVKSIPLTGKAGKRGGEKRVIEI